MNLPPAVHVFHRPEADWERVGTDDAVVLLTSALDDRMLAGRRAARSAVLVLVTDEVRPAVLSEFVTALRPTALLSGRDLSRTREGERVAAGLVGAVDVLRPAGSEDLFVRPWLEARIGGTRALAELVDAVERELTERRVRMTLKQRVVTAAAELASNTLYHGVPADDGAPSWSDWDRRAPLSIDSADAGWLQVCGNERWLAVEACDDRGGLGATTVFEAFANATARRRVERPGHAGAGLGLSMAWSAADHLSFHVRPGRRTRACAWFRRSRPRRPGRSLAVFDRERAAEPIPED